MFLSKRQLIGLLVAPLFAPMVFFIIVYILATWPTPFSTDHGNPFDAFLIVMAIGTPISYLVAIFLGIPILKIAEKFNQINFNSIVLGGGVVAILPLLITEILNGTLFDNPAVFNIYLLLFVCGVPVGIIFWFVSVRSNQSN